MRTKMRTKAIIIKKQPTNEYDELITCYTQEFGKLTAVAKSVLKSSSLQAMHLDNFNLVDFELINGKSMPIIAAAQADNSFRNIKSSLPLLAVAQFFADVVDKMIFDLQKDEALWGFLVDVLEKLNTRVKPETALTFFRQQQFYMLGVLGYGLEAQRDKSRESSALDHTFECALGSRLKSLGLIYSVLR
ncbi:MAG: DNA repair protein RecO [Candidatus Paceibacterota bacterium]